MTLNDGESRKDIWSAIFRRKGADGAYTHLFDDWDTPQKEFLLKELGQVRPTELPVVASIENRDNWLFLTTERLAWSLNAIHTELSVGAICDAVADFDQLMSNRQNKREMRSLYIITEANERHSIAMEPGPPLMGIWHILKNIGTRNLNMKAKKY